MEFFPTKRGGTKLVYEGREYHHRKTYVNGNKFWQCNSKKGCKGNLTLSTENLITKDNPHSPDCVSNMAKYTIFQQIVQLKRKISENYDPIRKQFEAAICELKDDGLDMIEELPKFENVKSGLYNARNKELKVPKLQHKLPKDVIVPEKFKKYLLADYNDEIRIVIFGSPDTESILQNFEVYLLDNTFKSCPQPFKQIYSIHGYNADTKKVIPLFFAFLQDKSAKTYQMLCDIIKTRYPNWNPSKMLMDYEKAAMNSVRKIFPDTIVKGCFYHFCRSLFKKAKQLEIKSRVQRRHVARCASLARLPLKCIFPGYNYIMKKSPKTEKVAKFNDYFNRFWLNDIQFIKTWCCQGEEIRNTNHLEGWHSRINRFVGQKKPSIAKILDIFVKEIKMRNTRITRKNDNYVEIDKEINQTIEELKAKEISVGHCLEIIAPFMF